MILLRSASGAAAFSCFILSLCNFLFSVIDVIGTNKPPAETCHPRNHLPNWLSNQPRKLCKSDFRLSPSPFTTRNQESTLFRSINPASNITAFFPSVWDASQANRPGQKLASPKSTGMSVCQSVSRPAGLFICRFVRHRAERSGVP